MKFFPNKGEIFFLANWLKQQITGFWCLRQVLFIALAHEMNIAYCNRKNSVKERENAYVLWLNMTQTSKHPKNLAGSHLKTI